MVTRYTFYLLIIRAGIQNFHHCLNNVATFLVIRDNVKVLSPRPTSTTIISQHPLIPNRKHARSEHKFINNLNFKNIFWATFLP